MGPRASDRVLALGQYTLALLAVVEALPRCEGDGAERECGALAMRDGSTSVIRKQ